MAIKWHVTSGEGVKIVSKLEILRFAVLSLIITINWGWGAPPREGRFDAGEESNSRQCSRQHWQGSN